MANETCWTCGQPAVWRVIGYREHPPAVIEFNACEKHVPFAVVEKENANANP